MTTAVQPRPIDEEKLMDLVHKAVGDLGAILSGTLVAIGDRLGLFKAIAEARSVTSAELAKRTGCAERYVREWLASMAASGNITYDGGGRYSMTPEQEIFFTNEESPAGLVGGYQVATAATRAYPRILEAFQSGQGVGWHEHDVELFPGTERFFRPGYIGNLVGTWLPALDGVVPQLEKAIRVADVGCGHGASTILMAQAFPNSQFVGFDYHKESIKAARERAAKAGVTNCTFEVASAKDYPGTYDLICHFDCLHDMGDPVGAAKHAYESLADGGTWMLIEPNANDDVADNLNPVGRVFYSASTLICTPASISQEVGAALGAQAGEARLREVAQKGGFTKFRRATETPFNIVLEGRK
jgi:SAM-dependent methyltransferase